MYSLMTKDFEFSFIEEKPHIENENNALEFGFKNVCVSLCKIIKNAPSPFTIGLMGKWGSGKSTLIENVAIELKKENIPLFNFDVWKHKEDSLRRTFLKELHEFLIAPEFNSIYTKKALSPEVFSKTNTSNDVIKFLKDKWIYHLCAIIIITTIIISISGLIYWIFKLINIDITPVLKTMLSSATGLITISIFIKYIDQFIKLEKKEEIKEQFTDPHQFENEFRDIISHIKAPKLIIAFDNIDRIQGVEIISVITTIKTFLEPIKKDNYEATVVFIIPCDYDAIKKVVENPHTNADEFLRKIFNSVIWLPNFHKVELEEYTRKLLVKTKVKCFDNPEIAGIIIKAYRDNPRQVIQFINTLLSQYLILKTKEDSNEFGNSFNVDENIEMLVKFISLRQRFSEVMGYIESERIYRTDINLLNLGFNGKTKILTAFTTFISDELNGVNNDILPLLFTLKYSEQEKSMPGISVLFDRFEQADIDKSIVLFNEIVKENQLAAFDDLIRERIITNKTNDVEIRNVILINTLIKIAIDNQIIKTAPRTSRLLIHTLKRFNNANNYSLINPKYTWEFIKLYGSKNEIDYPLTQWISILNNYVSDHSENSNKYNIDQFAKLVLEVAIDSYPEIKKMSSISEIIRFTETYIGKYNAPYPALAVLLESELIIDRFASDNFVRILIDKISLDDFKDNEFNSPNPFNIIYKVLTIKSSAFKENLLSKLNEVSEQIKVQPPVIIEVYYSKLAELFTLHNFNIQNPDSNITSLFQTADFLYDTQNYESNHGIVKFYISIFNVNKDDSVSKIRMSDGIRNYFENFDTENIAKIIEYFTNWKYSSKYLNIIIDNYFHNESVSNYIFNNNDDQGKSIWINSLLFANNEYGLDLIEQETKLLSLERVVQNLLGYISLTDDLTLFKRGLKVIEHVDKDSEDIKSDIIILLRDKITENSDEHIKAIREFLQFSKISEDEVFIRKITSELLNNLEILTKPILNILLDQMDKIESDKQEKLIAFSFERLGVSKDLSEIRLLYELLESQNIMFEGDNSFTDKLETLEGRLLYMNDVIQKEHLNLIISINSKDPIVKKLQKKLIKGHKNIILTSTEKIRDTKSGKRCVELIHDHHIAVTRAFPEFTNAHSQWITKRILLSDEETIDGNEYTFSYKFTVPINEKNIVSAKIILLIDDFVQVYLNNAELSEMIESNYNAFTELDLKRNLKSGLNEFKFNISNISFRDQYSLRSEFYNSKEKWNMNPFGINFRIDIQFE